MNSRSCGIGLLLAVCALFSGCSKQKEASSPETTTQAAAVRETDRQIDDALRYRLDSAVRRIPQKWPTAICVYDLTADKPLYGKDENNLMPTASCMKLLTGIAGIHRLGADHTFTTRLFAKGTLRDSILTGSVALRADFDPLFSWGDLRLFCEKLRVAGVREMRGPFIIDRAGQEAPQPEQHWSRWDYQFDHLGPLYADSLRLLSSVRQALADAGIAAPDSLVRYGEVDGSFKQIYSLTRPLSRVVRPMWKYSSNMQSMGLFYAIGHAAHPQLSPMEGGLQYVRQFICDEVGRRDSCFVVHDGCGLCVENQLSPSLLVDLLRYAYADADIYHYLRAFLPLSGHSGTLYDVMTEGPAHGRILAKTGTLSNPFGVSTLSGYCTAQNGHRLCFSIMNAHMSVLDARVVQRRLCEVMVR